MFRAAFGHADNQLKSLAASFISQIRKRKDLQIFTLSDILWFNLSMQVSEILQLSVAERIQIVEDIWDSISESPESLELSEAEKLELGKRLESYRQNPNEGIEWETLKKNLSENR